jgi:opacity protein-like surface antigen
MKKIAYVIILVVSLRALAEAAAVHLKDGGTLHGTVVSATAQEVQLHTEFGMQIIPTDRIERIDYSDAVPAASAPPPAAAAPAAVVVSRRPLYVRETPPLTTGYPERKQMFSLGFGMVAPLSRVDFAGAGGGTASNGDPGLLLDGHYDYSLSPRLSLGSAIEWSHRSGGDSQSLLPNSHTDVFGNTLLLMGTVKYALTDNGWAKPYILGGIGADHASTIVEARPNPGFSWSDTGTDETRTLMDDSNWGLATTARLGVDFSLLDPGVFTLELGWNHLNNPSYNATQAGHDVGLDSLSGSQNALVFALRWGWRF